MDEIRSEIDQPDIECSNLTQTEQRSLIFHLLYALEAFEYELSLEAITDNFARGYGIIIPRESDVFIKTNSIINERDVLDQAIIPLIENWRLDRLGVPTRLILRMSIWELRNTKTDPVVVINEAIELAQSFAEKDAYKFINGVLDKYVKDHEQEK